MPGHPDTLARAESSNHPIVEKLSEEQLGVYVKLLIRLIQFANPENHNSRWAAAAREFVNDFVIAPGFSYSSEIEGTHILESLYTEDQKQTILERYLRQQGVIVPRTERLAHAYSFANPEFADRILTALSNVLSMFAVDSTSWKLDLHPIAGLVAHNLEQIEHIFENSLYANNPINFTIARPVKLATQQTKGIPAEILSEPDNAFKVEESLSDPDANARMKAMELVPLPQQYEYWLSPEQHEDDEMVSNFLRWVNEKIAEGMPVTEFVELCDEELLSLCIAHKSRKHEAFYPEGSPLGLMQDQFIFGLGLAGNRHNNMYGSSSIDWPGRDEITQDHAYPTLTQAWTESLPDNYQTIFKLAPYPLVHPSEVLDKGLLVLQADTVTACANQLAATLAINTAVADYYKQNDPNVRDALFRAHQVMLNDVRYTEHACWGHGRVVQLIPNSSGFLGNKGTCPLCGATTIAAQAAIMAARFTGYHGHFSGVGDEALFLAHRNQNSGHYDHLENVGTSDKVFVGTPGLVREHLWQVKRTLKPGDISLILGDGLFDIISYGRSSSVYRAEIQQILNKHAHSRSDLKKALRAYVLYFNQRADSLQKSSDLGDDISLTVFKVPTESELDEIENLAATYDFENNAVMKARDAALYLLQYRPNSTLFTIPEFAMIKRQFYRRETKIATRRQQTEPV